MSGQHIDLALNKSDLYMAKRNVNQRAISDLRNRKKMNDYLLQDNIVSNEALDEIVLNLRPYVADDNHLKIYKEWLTVVFAVMRHFWNFNLEDLKPQLALMINEMNDVSKLRMYIGPGITFKSKAPMQP